MMTEDTALQTTWWSEVFAREPAEPPDDQGELNDAPYPLNDPEPWVWELCPPCVQLLAGPDRGDEDEESCFCRLAWPASEGSVRTW